MEPGVYAAVMTAKGMPRQHDWAAHLQPSERMHGPRQSDAVIWHVATRLCTLAGIVITNDGNAILREVDVSHPAAKVPPAPLHLCGRPMLLHVMADCRRMNASR